MTDAQHPPVHGPAEALAPLSDYVAAVAASQPFRGSKQVRHAIVPSTTVDGATVSVAVHDSDPSYLGTFDRTANTRMITVTINATIEVPPDQNGRSTRQIDLPYDEQVHWVRAVLGDLTDYAYKAVSDIARFRVRPAFFVVFVCGDGRPALAPSDFEWFLVCGGAQRAYPDKVVPRDRELLGHLRRKGALVPASSIPHPQVAGPPAWAQQFISAMTSTIADWLGRLGEDRGFTVEEVSLHGVDRATVRYIWHANDGDVRYGFDIDLDGLRAHRSAALDDPRASTAGASIGGMPFGQPIFRSERIVDGRRWIDIPGENASEHT